MIDRPTTSVLRLLFDKHRKRFPNDEYVEIHIVEPSATSARSDTLGFRIDRMRGFGLDCQYRHAQAEVSMAPLYRGDRGAIVTALAGAIEDLVRLLLRAPIPTFRIRRDARRLSHRRDVPKMRRAKA